MDSQPVELKPVIDPEMMFAVAQELEHGESEPAVTASLSPNDLMNSPITRLYLLGMT